MRNKAKDFSQKLTHNTSINCDICKIKLAKGKGAKRIYMCRKCGKHGT